jgi:hypothetical protein
MGRRERWNAESPHQRRCPLHLYLELPSPAYLLLQMLSVSLRQHVISTTAEISVYLLTTHCNA